MLMTPMDWAGIAAAVTATLAGVGAFSRWMIKAYLSELKPNGGTSLNDKIKLEVLPMLTEIKIDLAEMKGRLDTHIEETNK
jgi:uncharacterized protein YicC (UPF0701 family)